MSSEALASSTSHLSLSKRSTFSVERSRCTQLSERVARRWMIAWMHTPSGGHGGLHVHLCLCGGRHDVDALRSLLLRNGTVKTNKNPLRYSCIYSTLYRELSSYIPNSKIGYDITSKFSAMRARRTILLRPRWDRRLASARLRALQSMPLLPFLVAPRSPSKHG